MPQPPDWKRVLETGIHFTELRRSQARRIASDLVAQGQLARDQIGAAVDELVDLSRRRSEELREVVRSEVQRQLGVLGLATKRDLDALERRLRASTSARGKAAPGKTGAANGTKRAPAKKKKSKSKAAASKAPATKATAKKSVATNAVQKSATSRNGVKKTAAKPAATRAR